MTEQTSDGACAPGEHQVRTIVERFCAICGMDMPALPAAHVLEALEAEIERACRDLGCDILHMPSMARPEQRVWWLREQGRLWRMAAEREQAR